MSDGSDTEVEIALTRLGKALTPARDWQKKANIARIVGAGPLEFRVGRFIVCQHIGRGAMGEVFAAHDDVLDRKVALKLLAGQLSVAAIERFAREARALARLSHPNIVQIHEVGEHEGAMFIAMEHLAGQTLSQWLAVGTRPWREIVAVFVEAGRGLAAAHAAGLVHRDFKPDNVIVGDDRRVRVLDFGLARAVGVDVDTAEGFQTSTSSGNDITQTGALVGTPGYMAPEQLHGGETTPAADQFSFCVALYEGLFGVRPFAGRDPYAIADAIKRRVLQSPRRTAPRRIAALVLRGLAARPEDRFASMDALVEALRRRAAPRRIWIAAASVGALAVLGGGLWYEAKLGQRCSGASEKIAEIWNDTRKSHVRDAIVATDVGFAPNTWQLVESTVDERAAAWVDRYRQVCEATQIRGEQSPAIMDRKMHCLDRQRADLRAAIGVLADADAAIVEQAPTLMLALPRAEACESAGLADDAITPRDPGIAARVDAQRDALARIETLIQVAQYQAAEAELAEVLGAADAIGFPPLRAEALLHRGRVREALARFGEARDDLLDAYAIAAEHGHADVEAEAAAELTMVIGGQEAKFDEGLRWGKIALALSSRPGSVQTRRARVLGTIAQIYRETERYEEARTLDEQALRIVQSIEGPTSVATTSYLTSLGDCEMMLRNGTRALELHAEALAIRERVLGPDHPTVARSYVGIGGVHSNLHDTEASLQAYRKALAIHERLGYPHPAMAGALNGVGLALTRRGELPEAITYFEKAIDVFERTTGLDHPSVAKVFTALGDAQQNLGDFEAALATHQRAREIREATLPRGAFATIVSAVGVGQMLGALKRYDEARPVLVKALQDIEASEQRDVNPILHAIIYTNLSIVAQHQGDVELGIAYAERGVELTDDPARPWTAAWHRETLLNALWLDPARRRQAHDIAQGLLVAYAAAPRTEHLENVREWIRAHPVPRAGGPAR